MTAMKMILTLLVFSSITFFIYGIFESRSKRKSLKSRLDQLDISQKGISAEELEMSKSFFERVLNPIFSRTGKFLGNYTPKGFHDRIEMKLARSGFSKIDPVAYLGIKGFIGVAFFAFAILVALMSGMKIESIIVYLIILPAIGFIGPDFWIQSIGTRRRTDINDKLPDLIDLLTVSVEAGLGFEQALMHASEKMKGAVSEEVKRLLQEMRLGKKRSDALRALADRIMIPDLTSFCAALVQADQLGVSITNVLRIQSDVMRQKRRQRAEEAAMKAPLKMLFPLVFFIFPTLFLILLGPAVISIMINLRTG